MQVASKALIWEAGRPKNVTMLIVRTGEYGMTVKLSAGVLAPGSVAVTVDWGDGTRETFPNLSNRSHTYSKANDFKIKISDDLSSFGYTSGNPDSSDLSRMMLIELVCLASKVTRIEGYAFNNCKNMRGVIDLPNVTSIGGYAFGTTLGITDFILPSMRRIVETSFYYGSSATRMYVDNATQISSMFWDYYGPRLTDMYIRNRTCEEIGAMSGFPFRARAAVRFHGSNGIVLGDGTIIHN